MKKQKHVVVYGYLEEEVNKLKSYLDNKLEINLKIISASGKENIKIADILETSDSSFFEDKEDKVLMFLDFLDEEIRYLLYNFPEINISKPLFCVLTEHNIEWNFDKLIMDLIEERKHFEEKRKSEGSC
ncbi:MAG: DUF3783 domain-containing protein [Candidatus Methanofastidiosa archaeon]|nr:DUF3783 domain-containing protein [Candidatus Methanofastidiosa archaeon]